MRVEQLLEPGHRRGEDRLEEILLGAEVVVERGLGEPEAIGYLLQRRSIESLLGEQLERDVENSGAGVRGGSGSACGVRDGRHGRHATSLLAIRQGLTCRPARNYLTAGKLDARMETR